MLLCEKAAESERPRISNADLTLTETLFEQEVHGPLSMTHARLSGCEVTGVLRGHADVAATLAHSVTHCHRADLFLSRGAQS
jgi:hypothetical protein